VRLDADQHASEEPTEEEGAGDAEDAASSDEAGGLRDDEADKSAARCAEGEADAHLLRAPRDGVGKDAVDADSGEDDREQGEAGDEQHDEAALRNLARDALVHGLDVKERLLWVDSEDGLTHGVREQGGIGGAAESDIERVGRGLRLGDVKLGLHLLFQTVVPYIIHNAHDGERCELVASHDPIEPLAKRIAGKVVDGKSAVDNGNGGRGCSVVAAEATPLNNGVADDAEVIRSDANPGRGLPGCCRWRRCGRSKSNGGVVNFAKRQRAGDSS